MVDKKAIVLAARQQMKLFTRKNKQVTISHAHRYFHDKQLVRIAATLLLTPFVALSPILCQAAFTTSSPVTSAIGLSAVTKTVVPKRFVSHKGATSLVAQQAEQPIYVVEYGDPTFVSPLNEAGFDWGELKTLGKLMENVFAGTHHQIVMTSLWQNLLCLAVGVANKTSAQVAVVLSLMLAFLYSRRRQILLSGKQKRSNFLGTVKQTAKYLFAGRTRRSPLQLISAQRTRFADWRVSLRRERQNYIK